MRSTFVFTNKEHFNQPDMYNPLNFDELKTFLDEKADYYNRSFFIETDPIQIPHLFSMKEDIEIAGLLTALIAWGQRKTIIKNAKRIVERMDNSPYDFILNFKDSDLDSFNNFVHRTINEEDIKTIIKGIKHIYLNHNGLEDVFQKHKDTDSLQNAISNFKSVLLEIPHQKRVTKHISDPKRGSAAKRINMYLRWMIRKDHHGVDFGIWESISPAILSCPLDIHTANVSRKLSLITRKQNDQKALNELDRNLRKMDSEDPVKYDFALFGLGAFEQF